jgi:hypothetical protein
LTRFDILRFAAFHACSWDLRSPAGHALWQGNHTASNSSAGAANLRSGRHDFIAAIALATPAPPASAVNTSALYNDQPANSLPRLNFDRHSRSPIKISRLSGALQPHPPARLVEDLRSSKPESRKVP